MQRSANTNVVCQRAQRVNDEGKMAHNQDKRQNSSCVIVSRGHPINRAGEMYRKLASKDVLVNALVAPVIVIIVLAAMPAQAQTYDPNYPVCIQTYGRDGNYID